MTIDFEGDAYLWEQLAGILMRLIDSGEIPPHRPVPSKRALREEYGVSANTVERAISELKKQGYLKTLHGRGLFVVPPADRVPGGLAKPIRRRRAR